MIGSSRVIRTVKSILPEGSFAVMAGVMSNGLATYLFLVLPPRLGGLSADDYAVVTRLWFLLFVVAPGLFIPVEQDLVRAISSARATGHSSRGLFLATRRFVTRLAMGAAIVVGTVAFFLRDRLFDGETGLVFALALGIVAYGGLHLGRGVQAGLGRFGRYGATFGFEGALRLVGMLALVVVGAVSTVGLGLVIVGATVGAATMALVPLPVQEGVAKSRRTTEVATSVGTLLVAGTATQFVANFAPLALAIVSTDHPSAGALSAAVILTRLPLFLYQAVQAALIPELTQMASNYEFAKFRSRVREVLWAGLIVLSAYAGVMIGLGPWMLRTLFGPDFGIDRITLTALSLGSGCFVLSLVVSHALLAMESYRHIVRQWVGATTTALVLVLVGMRSIQQITLAFTAATLVAFALGRVALHQKLLTTTSG
jgi:O-antigen/teichoic acid export membrane protein